MEVPQQDQDRSRLQSSEFDFLTVFPSDLVDSSDTSQQETGASFSLAFPTCTICEQKLEIDQKSWGCTFQRSPMREASVKTCGKCYEKWAQGILTSQESNKVLCVLCPLMDSFVVLSNGMSVQDHFN